MEEIKSEQTFEIILILDFSYDIMSTISRLVHEIQGIDQAGLNQCPEFHG